MLVQYTGKNSEAGPSPRIWSRFNLISGVADRNIGCELFDDFRAFHGTVAANVGSYASGIGGYRTFEDTNCSVKPLATEAGGVIELATDGTDNQDVNVSTSGMATGVSCVIKSAANGGKRVAFETRINVSAIVTQNIFLGLGEEGLAANNGIFGDTGTIADKDLVGFFVAEGAGATVLARYNKAGAGGVTTSVATAATLVADTWVKLGFTFEPEKSDLFTWYVDGEIVGTFNGLSSTLFPGGEELALYLNIKEGTNAARKLRSDWVRLYQEIR